MQKTMKQSKVVIITEGHLRTALYVLRSLGRKGIKAICVSEYEKGIGLSSKYCWRRIRLPPPQKDPEDYLQKIESLISKYEASIIFPIHENSLILFSQPKVRERLERLNVEIPIPDYSSLQKVIDKYEIIKIASSIGITVPRTYFINDLVELKEIADEINYPAIIKIRIEKDIPPGPNNRYKIVNNPRECIEWYKILHEKSPFPIVQEIIEGDGYGFFALFDKSSEPKAIFCHHRLREYPITGGPSTLCESVYEPRIIDIGIKLLKNLKWYGVAMVEFKWNKVNEPVLMEINPRFWGSTPLAIESGVDFPYLLFKLAIGEKFNLVSYSEGIKIRFLDPDIRAAQDYLINKRINDGIRVFLDLFNPKIRDGIFSWDDVKPSLLYMIETLKQLGYTPYKVLKEALK